MAQFFEKLLAGGAGSKMEVQGIMSAQPLPMRRRASPMLDAVSTRVMPSWPKDGAY